MSRPGLWVAVATLWLALAVWLAPSFASAALLPTHDLASLAFLAEHVVRATRLGERPGAEGSTITSLRVDHVYAGALERGATLELDLGLYGLELEPFERGSKKPEPSDPIVLFLASHRREKRTTTGVPSLHVVSSGMRVTFGGRVHRFEQWSNPGGFAPVPQGPEPCEAARVEVCREPVSVERFGIDLERAIARAKQAREVLGSSTTSTSALLDWIGPPGDAPGAPHVVLGGYVVDAIAGRARELVLERGSLGDLLEAAARARGRGLSMSRPSLRFARDDFAAVARSEARSVREREAALELLANGWFSDDGPSPVAIASFAPLLDDAEPRVRAAVIPVLRAHPSADTFATWLRARHAKETDPDVMRAILNAARDVSALPFPEPPGVVLPELPSATPSASAPPAPSGEPQPSHTTLDVQPDAHSGCACTLAGPEAHPSRGTHAATLPWWFASVAAVARRRRRARASSPRSP